MNPAPLPTPSSHPPADHGGEETTHFVRRALLGDLASLDWVVRQFSPLLLMHARNRVGRLRSPGLEPEDLVQRVWAITLPKLAQLQPRDNRYTPVLRSYLHTTLKQDFMNWLRASARRRAHGAGAEVDQERAIEQSSSPTTGLVTRICRSEAVEALWEALQSLSESDRELIVRRGLEEESYEDLSVALGADAATLRVRFHRAILRLKGHLHPEISASFDEM